MERSIVKVAALSIATFFLFVATIPNANALVIDADTTEYVWFKGTSPNPNLSASDVENITGSDTGSLTEIFKENVGELPTGTFASSFEVDFINGNNATIDYVGLDLYTIFNPLYLVVKDGAMWHYIYDLIELGWVGEQITLSNFGPPGDFSHIAMYSTSTPVPEPSTFALLGLGFLGLGLIGLRNRRNRKE